MERVIIEFTGGAQLEADVNGSCYIVDDKPLFPEDLTEVTIRQEGQETLVKNARIVEAYSVDGRYWFSIIETPEGELWKASIEDALCELSADME